MSLRQIIVSAPKDALPDILRQAEEHEALSTTATRFFEAHWFSG